MNDCIGFFDSGVGGISVMRAARKLLPNENFFFFGDNRNAPYGKRPPEELRSFCLNDLQRLLDHGVKAVVAACNTATACYMDILQEQTDVPIIGISPALHRAQQARHGGEILAIATYATLHSQSFHKQMCEYGENVIPVVGEGLVEVVESGLSDTPEAMRVVEKLLNPYRTHNIDGIVLGCTHYPFLIHSFRRLFPNADYFDDSMEASQSLANLLDERGIRSDSTPGRTEYATSGDESDLRLMRKLMEWE